VLSPRVALRCFYFAFFVAIGAYLPYFPAWLAAQGIDGIRMGVLSALLPALTVVGPPAFGLFADAVGIRGSLLRFTSMGACLAFAAICLFAANGTPLGFGGLFACILAFGFFRTPMQLLSDVVALEQGGDYGRQRVFGSIGFMVTAPIVGYYVDLRSPIVLPAIILSGLAVGHLATWPLPKHGAVPRPAPLREAKRLLAQPEFRLFLVAAMLGQLAHVGYDVTLSLHLAALGFSGTMIGVAWTISTAAEVLLMVLAAPLMARSAPAVLLLVSLVVGTLRWVVLGVVTDPMLILLLQPLHAVSFALRWLASMQIVRRLGNGGPLGTAQGIHLAAFSVGSVFGTLVCSALYKAVGGHGVFYFCAMVALFASGAAVLLVQHRGTLLVNNVLRDAA
jgi:MFS transporter, PPP family, 3-phenylpropionic acid transporter